MQKIKNYDLVQITKLNKNINLIDKKISLKSCNIKKDLYLVIIKEGYGIYKVNYKNKTEYWFYMNYRTLYIKNRNMNKMEIIETINYLNEKYK